MTKNNTKPVWAGLAALLLVLVSGAWLINVYVQKEQQRDLDNWSIRLGILAEDHVGDIEGWLQSTTVPLTELANNASLQLYLWQLLQRQNTQTATDPTQAEPAQLAFLRNLLLASAQRSGYATDQQQPEIPANLPQTGTTGLALLNTRQQLIVSTSGFPQIGSAFRDAIHQAIATNKPVFSQLAVDLNDNILLGIAVPVPMILGAEMNDVTSGVILGVQNASRTLYPLLKSRMPLSPEDQALLVRRDGNQVIYLSPTRDGGKPVQKSLSLDREQLAAAAAVLSIGQFGEYLNYQGQRVLSTSRSLYSVPWILVQQADAKKALEESNRHQRFLIISFSLLLFFIAATLVAAWRHGSSVRAHHDAEELQDRALKLQHQTQLLHAVTDNVESAILLLDNHQQVLFANDTIARQRNSHSDELIGNSLTAVIGPSNATPFIETIEQIKTDGLIHHCTRQMSIDDTEKTFQCTLVPVHGTGQSSNTILIVLNDITDLQQTHRRHSNLLRNLIDTLMHVVDLHDPYSADHSSRTVEVANAIGMELRLDESSIRTLDMAASLANLGKIMIPKEILTKTEPLSEAEHDLLRRHVRYSVELLQNLEFEGPVTDTIAQKHEFMDGSGYPAGLNGDQILLTARILAVANAFVALVSPRAYRQAIAFEPALNQLLSESGSRYDRHVIAALFHIAENRSDWKDWSTPD